MNQRPLSLSGNICGLRGSQEASAAPEPLGRHQRLLYPLGRRRRPLGLIEGNTSWYFAHAVRSADLVKYQMIFAPRKADSGDFSLSVLRSDFVKDCAI